MVITRWHSVTCLLKDQLLQLLDMTWHADRSFHLEPNQCSTNYWDSNLMGDVYPFTGTA
jgi:hypothetical protein